MKPNKHPSNNMTFGPPAGWNDRGGKLELPTIDVTRVEVGRLPVFVSFWKPTPEEIGCLLRGGVMQLACVGGQPAASLTVVAEHGGGLVLPH